MAQVAVRFDTDSEAALDRLVARNGKSRSQVVREAVVALDREAVLEQVRQESRALMSDEADMAETRAIFEEMRSRRAW
jgi:Arc/MetJ-type ribon-helix-helix transcriptional regulator